MIAQDYEKSGKSARLDSFAIDLKFHGENPGTLSSHRSSFQTVPLKFSLLASDEIGRIGRHYLVFVNRTISLKLAEENLEILVAHRSNYPAVPTDSNGFVARYEQER